MRNPNPSLDEIEEFPPVDEPPPPPHPQRPQSPTNIILEKCPIARLRRLRDAFAQHNNNADQNREEELNEDEFVLVDSDEDDEEIQGTLYNAISI